MTSHLEVMVKAAKAAGEIILNAYGKNIHRETKTDKSVVTQTDKDAEEAIIKILVGAFPYSILAEESGAEDTSSDYTWVIDPIDGTSNFAKGIPLFAVSIGLVRDNKPVAGVIFNPVLDEMYAAEAGRGARLNGKPIQPPQGDLVDLMFAAVGEHTPETWKRLSKVIHAHDNFRRMGSAAVHLAYLATGVVDGIVSRPRAFWDIAAGVIICTEVGCVVTDWDGKPWMPQSETMLIAPKRVHEILLKDLEQ